MKLWREMRDRNVAAACDRGDWRQAIAYHLQCAKDVVPEDVGAPEFRAARDMGARAWWRWYRQSRTEAGAV